MADYEGIFVVDAKLGEGETEKALVGVEEVIGKNGGKVAKRESWGKKNLAYEVKGVKEGVYFLVNFRAEPGIIQELEKSYRLNEAILRYLILRRTQSNKRAEGTEQERKTV